MTAIILAAGMGKRMGPQGRPKCLLPVGGTSLLQRSLELLAAAGVHRLVLVVGYEAAAVAAEAHRCAQGLALTLIENPRYQEGAILSLWAAREACDDDLLIMDADVLYPPVMLKRLLASPHRNCLLVDGSITETGEEQMVLGRDGRVLHIAKHPAAEFTRQWTTFGESIGFLKLSREAAERLRRLLEARVASGVTDIEHEQIYPELFQEIVVGYEHVDGLPWTEIDTPQDLRTAETQVLPRL